MKPTKTSIALQCLQGHRMRVSAEAQPAMLGQVEGAILDGIESRAVRDPAGRIADLHRDFIALLKLRDLQHRPDDLSRAGDLYEEALGLTFPATSAFIAHSQGLTGLSSNVSLDAVEHDVLREIDLSAHEDPTYRAFVDGMIAILKAVKSPPDPIAYSQFFEIYAEAMVLRFLRGCGIPTSRVSDTRSAPDFECELEDGRSYFVEVKALEIVGGLHRNRQIMVDGLEPNIELERQLGAGKRIASATGEVAPYKRAFGDEDYDPRSAKRVIDTVRDKCRQAFKPSQFKRGPTFALAVADRLVLHGWSSALAPYYFDDHGSTCVSGMLWQAAFGTVGTPVLRHPDFEGKPNVEGHLDKAGLYADPTVPFPGLGLVVLQRSSSRRLSYGLKAPVEETDAWSSDDTEEALGAMCHAWNDQGNSRGFALSRYQIE
ncbi:MAG: hypothetical protein QOI38_2292 [Sphingomonadales bacterium]|jgi:hypothetical protein|nr:hypothetical protein [Sphingomonadales bacterium]